MFENHSYKSKLVGVILVFIVLFFVANRRSYKTTFESYKRMERLENELNLMNSSPVSMPRLKKEKDYYDKLIGKTNINSEEIQHDIINFLSSFDVKIKKMNEVHFSSFKGFEVVTNHLILRGDFRTLLNIIHNFEKKNDFSRIVSVSFYRNSKKSRSNNIEVNIIFQNYRK